MANERAILGRSLDFNLRWDRFKARNHRTGQKEDRANRRFLLSRRPYKRSLRSYRSNDADCRTSRTLCSLLMCKQISKNFFDCWFRKVRKRSGNEKLQVSRSTALRDHNVGGRGDPTATAMLAAGIHRSSHTRSKNLQKDQLKNACQKLLTNCEQEKVEQRIQRQVSVFTGVPDGI